ncbi:MAG TPA: di-heme oxidoredictase family protein, partial [Chitinophagales bacterium]|nr:di-heme oxidoredictase family protein [Chitinophagales bacterium]
EAMVDISYVESTYSFPDGETYSLRKPIYTIINNYAPLPSDVALSVRVAPPVFGLGLLEIIPEEAIIALADEQDADKNGISGKANYVYDVRTGLMALGRFGWKANQPNLDQQNAAAFNEDMGITNPIFQTESCFGQLQFDGITDEPEITMPVLEDVTFYVRTLAVPAPRNLEDANIQEGKMYFYKAGCNTCHNPSFTTGIAINAPELSNQKIYPYTDMLLHDMGDAMGDGRQDYLATGNEWKTRPLWGIGLTQLANGHTVFLHDGRARNLTEAIMWHGGEAEASTEYFESLTKEQRDKLLEFLMAL